MITICEECARGTAAMCLFMRIKDPDEGLAKMGLTEKDFIKQNNLAQGGTLAYKVKRCPHFKPGPIPPISKGRLVGIS